MYLNGLGCDCEGNLSGMGIGYESLIPLATSYLNKGGGGSSGGGMPSVNTSVNTQVSPQISPVFIQQEKPENSAINAGVNMATPVTGAMPGFDTASGYLPTGLPSIPSYTQISSGFDKRLLLIPAGLLVIALFLKKRRVGTQLRRLS